MAISAPPCDQTPVQLDGDGPFQTPEVEAFVGLQIGSGGQLPPQACFRLKGGKTLYVPMDDAVLEQLLNALRPIFEGRSENG